MSGLNELNQKIKEFVEWYEGMIADIDRGKHHYKLDEEGQWVDCTEEIRFKCAEEVKWVRSMTHWGVPITQEVMDDRQHPNSPNK